MPLGNCGHVLAGRTLSGHHTLCNGFRRWRAKLFTPAKCRTLSLTHTFAFQFHHGPRLTPALFNSTQVTCHRLPAGASLEGKLTDVVLRTEQNCVTSGYSRIQPSSLSLNNSADPFMRHIPRLSCLVRLAEPLIMESPAFRLCLDLDTRH